MSLVCCSNVGSPSHDPRSPRPEEVAPGHQPNSSGDCLANRLMLAIKKRIQRLLNKITRKLDPRLLKPKQKIKKFKELNQKKIEEIMLAQKCTKKSESSLIKILEALKKTKSRERIVRWYIESGTLDYHHNPHNRRRRGGRGGEH